MLPNKVESIQETHLLEQEGARISREFLALRKCHPNLNFYFLSELNPWPSKELEDVFVQMPAAIGLGE